MTLTRLASLGALLAVFAFGCSSADDSDDAVAQPGELTDGGVLSGVRAVRINGKATVAAPKKVAAILENVGLAAGAPKPNEGALRCIPSYSIEFLDADAKVLGSAGFVCNAGERASSPGTLQVNGKSYLVTAKDVDAIEAVGNAPRAIGDLLFGSTKFEIIDSGAVVVFQSDAQADVDKVSAAMKGDDVPRVGNPGSLCIPDRTVRFFGATNLIASVQLVCGGKTGVVSATLNTTNPASSTQIDIDAGVVFAFGQPKQ